MIVNIITLGQGHDDARQTDNCNIKIKTLDSINWNNNVWKTLKW